MAPTPRHILTSGQLGSLTTLRAIIRERRLLSDRRSAHEQLQQQRRLERWIRQTSATVADLEHTSERCMRVARQCRETVTP
jgi:hypothetical protein